MVDSTKRRGLTRREALILSSTAGVGVAATNFAAASDSIKTAAHQGPGNLTTPRSAIAKTQYGNANAYMKIFDANKPMLSNPDKIYPGQVLRIPAA